MTTTAATALCLICDESFNAQDHKPIQCPLCKYEACRTCCGNYLLTQTNLRCMNNRCQHEWSYLFLLDSFSKKFIDGPFRKHRENTFYDLEKGLLPATQQDVETIIRYQAIVDSHEKKMEDLEMYSQICIDIYNTYLMMGGIQFIPEYHPNTQYMIRRTRVLNNFKMLERVHSAILRHDIPPEKKNCFTIHFELVKNWIENRDTLAHYRRSIKDIRENGSGAAPVRQERRQFIKHCPSNDCRGFLSTHWKCGLCDVNVCSSCHVIKTEGQEHVCKKEDVETALFLMRDTKPCPSCAASIHKIDGCDQMWCVQCHTAFSWTTGALSTGLIHNPHYFQHMRTNQREERNPHDIICGRELNHHFISRLLNDIRRVPLENYVNLSEAQERLRMVQNQVEQYSRQILFLKSYAENFVVHNVADNRKIRIDYLMKEMDEPAFKRKIFIKQRHNEFNREFRNLLFLFRDVVTELLYNLEEQLKSQLTIATLENFTKEVVAIQELVNQDIARLSLLFKIKERSFDVGISSNDWSVEPCR